MRINRRRNRRILPVLLAALLMIEPAAFPAVYAAEEGAGVIAQTGADAEADTETDQADESGAGQAVEDEQGFQETEKEPGAGEGQAGPKDGQESAGAPDEDKAEPESAEESKETNAGDTEGNKEPDSEDAGKEDGREGEGTDAKDTEPADEAADSGNEGMAEGGEGDPEGAEENNEDGEAPEETENADEEENLEDSDGIKDKILEGFTEMSSDYRLTSEQMENKFDLASHLDEIDKYQEGVDYAKGQIITFAKTQEEADRIAAAYNAQIVRFEYGVLTLQLDKGDTVGQAMRAAASDKTNLPAVWPNYYRYAYVENAEEGTALSDDTQEDTSGDAPEAAFETDDYIEIETEEYEAEEYERTDGTGDPEQPDIPCLEASGYSDPYLKSTSAYYQYHHTTIGSPYAWAAGSTGRGIKVAVLDTGVADHTDVSAASIYGNGTSDNQGHGTHVAGIIGARANGRLGVGVAPDVTLYSGNVLPDGTGTDDEIIRAIRAAQNKQVDIINMSLGGLGYNGAFQQAVNKAYEQGIAIFAASGNDGGVNYNYPACYDHVISVAATDAGNERAYFSNYGNKVDLSAPGVAIYSTCRDGSSYVRMNGTSMACPVAAGEAAVILSGSESLRGKTGKARVDALESTMKSNARKAGSGMGSGITILPEALKLSTAVMKPAAPVIQITPDNTAAAQNVRVTIKAQGGATVYYTTDGKTPVFKNGLAGNGTVQYTNQFSISNQPKATVKAVAVNESGVASAVSCAAYTLKPYVSSITISGIGQIARGRSAQMQAEVLPAYASNKKVTWELYTTDGRKIDAGADAKLAKETGVGISPGGKVTAAKNAKTGSYVVRATAKDGRGRSASYRIDVIDAVKIDSVKFTEKNVTLVLPDDKSYDLGAGLNGKCKDGTAAALSDFIWSSSNTAVARVSASGIVTPVRAGKVTVTALANDSGGRKAACTITVRQHAAGITITGSSKVAAGRSQTYKAAVTPSYTTNKKVIWKLSDSFGEVTAQRAREIGVSINPSSGKLTTTSKAAAGSYTVTATAADGSGKSASRTVMVRKGAITGIIFTDKSYNKVSLFRKQQTAGTRVSATVYAEIQGKDADTAAYEVINSNPGIASAAARGTAGRIMLTVRATGNAAGRTNITIASTDGSDKKLTCAVTVSNPVSGIKVAPAGGNNQCVARGKSLQLKAVVETEHGKVSKKSVAWELYTQNGQKIDAGRSKTTGVKISANGKVTASKNAVKGSYTARAVAKDGSGVTGSYMISVGSPATYIKLYNSYGYLSTSKKYRVYRGRAVFLGIYSNMSQGSFSVSSSNPGVISASLVNGGVVVAAGKKGSATVTLKAMDGSGKKVKYRFVVR